jgi:PhnB protein
MAPRVKPIRDGYHTVIASLTVKDAQQAIQFYQTALGAVERNRMAGPGGKGILHAELQIGDSRIFLADEGPNMSTRAPESLHGTSASFHLNVEDADEAFARAVKAGAKPIMPPMDMFWGDRYAQVMDPFGHVWGLGTHKEDLTPAEVEQRGQEFYRKMASAPR